MSIIVKSLIIFIYIVLGFKVNILTKVRIQKLIQVARVQKF